MKDEVFQFRLTEEDRETLQELSKQYGISRAGVLRLLLRQARTQMDALLMDVPLPKDPAPALEMSLI